MHLLPASEEVWQNSALGKSGDFDSKPTALGDILRTIPGWTGVMLVVVTVIALPFTFKRVMRLFGFNSFWYSHMTLYTIFTWMFLIHGVTNWLFVTQAWLYCGIPYLFYLADSIVLRQFRRMNNHALKITHAQFHGTNVLELQIEKPNEARFNQLIPGMYIQLNVPKLASHEWHPFTLTSAPHEPILSAHIQNSGDWIESLHDLIAGQLYKQQQGYRISWPEVRVDGPIGAPAQKYNQYEIVLLIAGGIGVTPAASILKDIAYRLQRQKQYQAETHCSCCKRWEEANGLGFCIEKVYFHWCNRDSTAFRWFAYTLWIQNIRLSFNIIGPFKI